MKRLISLLLTIVISVSCLSVFVYAERDISGEEVLAQELKELGLFKGVSDTDFDLDRAPSRVEALVMLIRVLGYEAEALDGVWRHPFADVPEWANNYVGFAYSRGLTNGQSSTQFGTGDSSAAMFVTFVLRALGYSDANGADFVWNDPFTLAKTVGILPDSVNLDEFWRADVVTVAHSSLVAYLKGSEQTLAQKLITAGVFTQDKFDNCYGVDKTGSEKPPVGELTAEEIYASCSPAVFYIEIYDAQGKAVSSGSGFFIDDKGTAVTNYHVIDDAYSAKVQLSGDGTVYDVTGIYDYDVKNDWAVIKVNCTGNKYLTIGDSTTAAGGATIYTIGSPLGLQNTISQGLISNPAREDGGVTYIQISAAISSGSSGGALINKYGEVIGITSATYIDGQNLNLAIPMTALEGYSTDSLTAFKDFQNVIHPKPTESKQQAAYRLLKNFIITNHSKINSSGNMEYFEIDDSSEKVQSKFRLYYDLESEYIIANTIFYFEDGITASLYVNFDDIEKSTQVYYYYTNPSANVSIEADLDFSNSDFNASYNYKFDNYNGDSYERGYDEQLARLLHCQALEFIDYIFDDYISGEYSVADFGYTTFIAENFDFSESTPSENRQETAFNLLKNFILKNYKSSISTYDWKTYRETDRSSSDGRGMDMRLSYNVESEYIVADITYYFDNTTSAEIFIDFHPDGVTTFVGYYYEKNNNVITGTLRLKNSDFNAKYWYRFDSYDGYSDIKSYDEELAQILHCSALEFVNYIFEEYISGDYSVADFGYTTFNAEDFQ